MILNTALNERADVSAVEVVLEESSTYARTELFASVKQKLRPQN